MYKKLLVTSDLLALVLENFYFFQFILFVINNFFKKYIYTYVYSTLYIHKIKKF